MMTFIKSLSKFSVLTLLATAVAFSARVSFAGPIFLTGHDPDFHAQFTLGAQNLLNAGLSFVTGGTYNGGVEKFLWVESRIAPPGGHLIGEDGLTSIGLVLGVHYDRADAAELPAVNFSDYSAIAVASNFGGLLTQAELDALIARAGDIATFINGGGGLFASAECFPSGPACQAGLLTGASPLYGYLPVTVSSIPPAPPFTVTAFGASLGLTDSDLNDPTHNSFGDIGGLTPVDLDQNGQATTLAGGDVTIGVCGDGVLDLGEQCDDGNTQNGDGCSDQCQIEVAPPPVKCNGLPVTIEGTNASETIKGTDGPDVIHGLGGNDVIFGKAGEDVICGGPGNDRLFGKQNKDKLFGQGGDDAMDGGGAKDFCSGGPGTDTVVSCESTAGLP